MRLQSTNSADKNSPHVRASNDAFGRTSPHWNLPFHVGNVTAAEILAYFPHWLKSVDVIDRFVMNGGKAKVIAGMLNRFRILPGVTIPTNSVCVMMQCAMRAFGAENWTMSNHSQIDDNRTKEWDPCSLDVSSFRTPRFTHPKKGSKKLENVDAEPIEFRDLAQDVKDHPSGSDALDLTRCVLYAVNHPHESWRFPVDFERLVNHLGGPQTPTTFHLDTEAFERHLAAIDSVPSRTKLTVAPLIKRVRFDTSNTMVSTRNADMRLTTPKKRDYEELNSAQSDTMNNNGKRRSGRLATQGTKDLRESDSDAGTPYKDADDYEPPQKKRKSAPASSVESEFISNHTTDSDGLSEPDYDFSDESLTPEPKRPVRASAQKGRRLTQKVIYNETPKTPRAAKGTTKALTSTVGAAPVNTMTAMSTPPATSTVPDYVIDPVLLGYACALESRAPVQVAAPVPGYDRLVVDEHNVWLYAEDGCITRDQILASAFSSQRFNNGPRRQAPFRELYRLSDPMPWDTSDWAENIRWAKEQWLVFGSDTWTEYDDHLEQITQWRREHMWWSEEAIRGGSFCNY